MHLDDQRIDDAALALLAVFSFDGGRCWKSFDWDVMDRLHARGLIDNPRSHLKSIHLTPEAMEQGLALAEKLFSRQPRTAA
jgi:hypothetical protein